MKAHLNGKFYFTVLLLCGMIAFVGWGIYFVNHETILMEDGAPMDVGTKRMMSVLFGLILLSWCLSLLVLLRQMLLGQAFVLDAQGVHGTASALLLFTVLLVVPVRHIPFAAVTRITRQNAMLTLHLDKSKLDVFPLFRPFVRKEYHLFMGFTKESPREIREALEEMLARYGQEGLHIEVLTQEEEP